MSTELRWVDELRQRDRQRRREALEGPRLGVAAALQDTCDGGLRETGLLRVLVPARLPVATPQTGAAEAPAPAAVIERSVTSAPPMSPDPDADVVIDVEARTVEAPADEPVATLPDESPRAPADERTHGAPAPRRGSRFFE